jgi:hypothetical protein
MKKRNKKYNKNESDRRKNAQSLINRVLTFYAVDGKEKQRVNMTDHKGEKIEIEIKHADAITKFRYKWSVMIAVFCIEKGLKTCKLEFHYWNVFKFQNELIEHLNDAHQDFIARQKQKNVNVIGAGWIASPSGRDITEDQAGKIFESIGAM